MLATAVFELLQKFFHATKIDNVANGQPLRWSTIADKINATVSDEVNYGGTKS